MLMQDFGRVSEGEFTCLAVAMEQVRPRNQIALVARTVHSLAPIAGAATGKLGGVRRCIVKKNTPARRVGRAEV